MSEPVFEASVRLRADTQDFEQQAQQSLKRTTDRLEASAQQAIRTVQQSSATALPGFAPNTTANDVLTQAIARARTLAAQPIEVEVLANTQPFERETTLAYEQAISLAEKQANVSKQAAVTAAQEATVATQAVYTAGAERSAAIAAARAKQAVSLGAQDAAREAEATLRKLEAEAADLRLRPATELQTRAETASVRSDTAALVGDQAAVEAANLEAVVLSTQAAAETMKLQAAEFIQAASQESGAQQALLQAKADNATVAAEKLRREADRLQREGLPPVVPTGGQQEPGQGGAFDRIRDLLRHESSGRTSGILGLLGGGLRFGVAGFAFTAAFESLRELQGLLRAEGDEAFTTEGKIRNLGAELLSGNLIGGIRALNAEKKATFVGGLAEELKALNVAADDSAISLEKVVALQRGRGDERTAEYTAAAKGLRDLGDAATDWQKAALQNIMVEQQASQELKNFITLQVLQGRISEEQAQQILKVAVNFDKQQRFASIAAAALDDYTRSLQRAGSESAKFGREGGPEGLRGPGQVASQGVAAGQGAPGAVTGQQTTGIPRPIITNPFPNPVFQAPDQEAAAATREAFAERIQNDRERLQQQLANLRIVQQQKRTAFEEAKAAQEAAGETGKAADEFAALVAATTAVGNKAKELQQEAQASREAVAAAGDRSRDARTARIADPDARLRAQLGDAQQDEAEAAAAVAAAKRANKSAKEIAEANATYQEAITARANIEQQIADNAKAAAQIAADDARNAEEVRLANNIAAAAQTEGKADDRKYYNEAIAHYKAVAADASETKTAREQARGTVRELVAGRKQALSGDSDPLALRQQLLQNALSRAEQTGSLPATRRAAQKIVDFWEEQVKSTTGIERAQAQASLIGARGRLQGVDADERGLAELRIRNRIQAAQLTKGKGDDKKAADALVEFWEDQFKHAKGVEKAQANASLIAAKLARKALDEDSTDSSGQGITTVDLLGISQQIKRDFAGNLLPTGSAANVSALFPGFTGPQAGGPEEKQVDELKRIREILERNNGLSSGAVVNVHQNFRAPDVSGTAQARNARFAMEEAFNG